MSYDGSDQFLCANGHQSIEDVYTDRGPEGWRCEHCNEPAVWSHTIDQTNEDLPPLPLTEISPEVREDCSACGTKDVLKTPAVYKIPTKEETDSWVLYVRATDPHKPEEDDYDSLYHERWFYAQSDDHARALSIAEWDQWFRISKDDGDTWFLIKP